MQRGKKEKVFSESIDQWVVSVPEWTAEQWRQICEALKGAADAGPEPKKFGQSW